MVTPRFLTCALLILGAAPLLAQTPGPRLLFTDIQSGPTTGGQNGLGPFISIYGEGFGATQGGSTVTIGGQPVASVTSWGQDNAPRGLDRIVVQPGPGVASGNIVVTVAGRASNGLPFTARAGNVYFVNQASGNDANPGTFAQPWATIWRPRATMVAGDIVYLVGGTFTQLDPDRPGWDTILFLDTDLAASGTAAAPIAYLGYPGNPPLLQNIAARRGILFNQDSGPLSYVVIGNVRFGLLLDAINVIGAGHRIVGNDLSNGGEGHKIGVSGDTSAIRILGNRLVSNGTPTTKYYCVYVQGFGVNSDVEVGWNEMRNQYGRSMQVYGHVAGDRVEDLRVHDNVMVGSELNNLLLGGSDGGTEILGTVTVTNNVIAGATGAEGLRVNDPQGTVVIENNTLQGNAVAQVYLQRAGVGRITLRDNILVAQAGQQYYEFDAGSSPASFVPASNLVHGAGPCAAWDTGCINQDPLFVGPSDYHLQPGSPAADAGVATSVSRDHDGIPRPQGLAYDIGAYEQPIVCPAITVNPASIPTGSIGAPYSQTFTRTGGTASGTFSLSGPLPAGLGFSSAAATLSGTPAQVGIFPIAVGFTDANGCVGSRGYDLTIGAAGLVAPIALAADGASNGVFEPDEAVTVAPTWFNGTGGTVALSSTATGFGGPAGPVYSIPDGAAGYGAVPANSAAACSDCFSLQITGGGGGSRPVTHWDTTFVETPSAGGAKSWVLHVGGSFADVPAGNPFYRFVETLLHHEITGGCTATSYCPGAPTTRAQMAVFVLVAKEGAGYAPPACAPPNQFGDVPDTSPFCRWIEELANRGVVGGCGGGNYCPDDPVTRDQMAIFALRTLDPALSPPACAPPNLFGDVPETSPFCRWVEELANRGVVGGCGGGNYCPTNPVTREQMGVFLSLTFTLFLYAP